MLPPPPSWKRTHMYPFRFRFPSDSLLSPKEKKKQRPQCRLWYPHSLSLFSSTYLSIPPVPFHPTTSTHQRASKAQLNAHLPKFESHAFNSLPKTIPTSSPPKLAQKLSENDAKFERRKKNEEKERKKISQAKSPMERHAKYNACSVGPVYNKQRTRGKVTNRQGSNDIMASQLNFSHSLLFDSGLENCIETNRRMRLSLRSMRAEIELHAAEVEVRS